ncbi:hypothetical protein [Nocardioides pacificus]
MDTVKADLTWHRLGLIAQLLHQAAVQVWDDADEAAPDSPLHDLGLGIYLAHSHASALLADSAEPPHDAPLPELQGRTPLQLLIEAEELIRPLPVRRAELVRGWQLVVDLCDLVREARSLGY